MGLEPGVTRGVVGHDADVRSIPLVAASGVSHVAQPNRSRQIQALLVSRPRSTTSGDSRRSRIFARCCPFGGSPTSYASSILGQTARHQGGPVTESRTRGWPAGRITGNARRSRGDKRRQLTAKPFDRRAIRVSDCHTQNDFKRGLCRTNDSRCDVAGPQALDQRIGESHTARRTRSRTIARPRGLGFGIAPHDGQHSAGRPAVSIDRHQLELVRRGCPVAPLTATRSPPAPLSTPW